MTESDYLLKEIRESMESAKETLLYGNITTLEKLHEMRGFVRAMAEMETFLMNYNRHREE